MATLTQGTFNLEFLLSPARGQRSFDKGTLLAASPALVAGTVLGKQTAGGKYVAYDEAGADDGRRVAAAILCYNTPDSAADQAVTLITRDAEVQESLLTGIDANGKVDLLLVGIVCR